MLGLYRLRWCFYSKQRFYCNAMEAAELLTRELALKKRKYNSSCFSADSIQNFFREICKFRNYQIQVRNFNQEISSGTFSCTEAVRPFPGLNKALHLPLVQRNLSSSQQLSRILGSISLVSRYLKIRPS